MIVCDIIEDDEKDVILKSKEDFEWRCKECDVGHRYKFNHHGEPKQYPCKVKSEYHYENDSADWYSHEFKYRVEKKCPECGHVTYIWSDEWE